MGSCVLFIFWGVHDAVLVPKGVVSRWKMTQGFAEILTSAGDNIVDDGERLWKTFFADEHKVEFSPFFSRNNGDLMR